MTLENPIKACIFVKGERGSEICTNMVKLNSIPLHQLRSLMSEIQSKGIGSTCQCTNNVQITKLMPMRLGQSMLKCHLDVKLFAQFCIYEESNYNLAQRFLMIPTAPVRVRVAMLHVAYYHISNRHFKTCPTYSALTTAQVAHP